MQLKGLLEPKKRISILIFKLISTCSQFSLNHIAACMKGLYFIRPLLSLAVSHSWQCHRSSLSTAAPLSGSKFLHLAIMDMDLHKEQSQKEVVKMSSRSKSTAIALHKITHKISKRSGSSSRQKSLKNSIKKISNKQSEAKITFKDQKKHRLVLQESRLPDGLELHYISKGKKLLKGYTKGRGIFCCCCNKVVSPTMFEGHAGRPSSRKPYQHIFLSNGMSLHHYASSLKLNCQKRVENNDLLCMVCQESGDLMFCDGCPRSFHKECVSDTLITSMKRFCKQCQISIKILLPKANDVKDGRVSGADPVELIAKKCIQIDGPCDLVACVLCRSCDFSEDGFNDQTSIVCDQCEKEYHIGCLKKDMNIDLKELPAGNWFCTTDCSNVHSSIEFLLSFGPLKIMGSYMDSVRKKLKDSDADRITTLDVRWFVFKGKDASELEKSLLTQAVDIFHDCFNPIIDSVTKKDFILSMAYGEQMGSSDFSGVYSALLTINLKVITAGMFRVFGREIAELPIVATSQPNQGKGYLQVFFVCFERLLSCLRVKKLVIPAADDATALWIKKFGFIHVPPKMLTKYRQTQTSMVAFQGTTLLQRGIRQGLTNFKRRRHVRYV